jgi:aminoglycoside 3-N-acetyltransferase
MDESSCRSQVARDLLDLGVKNGDTILVHSSFKSLGPVPGGIETLLLGLFGAIGASGTLLMPALCWALRPPEEYNVRESPVNVGAVAEYFRTRSGTFRSIHPTHSVCAVGRRTHDLLDDHFLDSTPCGSNSPFAKITEIPAKIIMLGCGLGPNATMHALEECIDHPCFLGKTFAFTITDWNGRTYQKEYRTHDFTDFRQRYDRVLAISNGSFIDCGRVLDAETYVIDTRSLRDAVIEKQRNDPPVFVDRKKSAESGR